jgi:transcriptional regulator with XRE-family HTH domain
LAEVRRQERISRRTVARELHVDLATVQQQEQESTDLPLSTLYRWRDVLKVPLVELLIDSNEHLSPPVLKRAHLVLIMKTACAILERAHQPVVRNLAQNLVESLVALMPELKGVAAWNVVGRRRKRNDYGVAASRRFLPHTLNDWEEF